MLQQIHVKKVLTIYHRLTAPLSARHHIRDLAWFKVMGWDLNHPNGARKKALRYPVCISICDDSSDLVQVVFPGLSLESVTWRFVEFKEFLTLWLRNLMVLDKEITLI